MPTQIKPHEAWDWNAGSAGDESRSLPNLYSPLFPAKPGLLVVFLLPRMSSRNGFLVANTLLRRQAAQTAVSCYVALSGEYYINRSTANAGGDC